jgi:hypothetical protein
MMHLKLFVPTLAQACNPTLYVGEDNHVEMTPNMPEFLSLSKVEERAWLLVSGFSLIVVDGFYPTMFIIE